MYCCPPMPAAPCPPACPPKPTKDSSSKYYREIGTAMIGNQLIIRMEKKKGKSKKSRDWDPPCDCDVVEIQRPSSKEGPKILKGPDNNRILFRVESKSYLSRKDDRDSMPHAISYEVGRCTGGPNTNDQCRTFTIYPVMNRPGSQEVHTDRVTEGDQNVFMLRVKKMPSSSDQPKRNVELELRTPKPPTQLEVQQAKESVLGSERKDQKKLVPEETSKKDEAISPCDFQFSTEKEPRRKKRKKRCWAIPLPKVRHIDKPATIYRHCKM
ncbi:uncharacterized protein LOC128875508 [Hylaeus volcanicus]|uniref:uncharacterized protein LOC128875508 n=1 Tax=Hylaeus volcanicus TaxID=313075 RepID=UPI0023B80F22|nr:uncharacterized protein LOC128875508 [Hylaeus volcanicus]